MRRYPTYKTIWMTTAMAVRIDELAKEHGQNPHAYTRYLLEKAIQSENDGDYTPLWMELLINECLMTRGFIYRCLFEVLTTAGWTEPQFNQLMDETARNSLGYARERVAEISKKRRDALSLASSGPIRK